MKLWQVDDVTTKEVVTVQQDTPYRDVVRQGLRVDPQLGVGVRGECVFGGQF